MFVNARSRVYRVPESNKKLKVGEVEEKPNASGTSISAHSDILTDIHLILFLFCIHHTKVLAFQSLVTSRVSLFIPDFVDISFQTELISVCFIPTYTNLNSWLVYVFGLTKAWLCLQLYAL